MKGRSIQSNFLAESYKQFIYINTFLNFVSALFVWCFFL